ncbi:MAG: MFS transporter [Candidatus Binatia bacterium]
MASRFAGGSAMTMLRAAIAWHVYSLTGSPFHLGLIGVAQFVPVLGLTLVGGAAADSFDRRRIIMMAQLVPLVCALGLVATTRGELIALPVLYGAVAVAAAAGAFENPARAALLPALVTREMFPRAVTLASTGQALAFMTGPASGGFIIAAAGIAAAYAAAAALLVASLLCLALLRPERPGGERRGMSWTAVREGLGFVRRNEVVLGCMTLDMFAVIFGGATALLPVYANDILKVGARGYGVLSAALEAGALAMSLALVFLPPVRRAGRALLVAVAIFGLGTIGFGLSTWFPAAIAFYVLCGMADQLSVVMRSTAIQLSTPDALRGRVSAVNFIFIGASNQLGAAESGFVAALTNPVFAVVSGGIGTLIVVTVVAARMPKLRQYRI